MKTWLKIILIFGSLAIATYFAFYFLMKPSEGYSPPELTYGQVVVDGNSMYPTMKDGQIYNEYKAEPSEGDIVAFDCLKPEAKDGYIKRLIEIREDGAWWVLGDNREHSYDSSEYGWILPSERSDVWVVKVK